MKKTLINFLFFICLCGCAYSQKKYCIHDSIPVFVKPNNELQPIGFLNTGDSVSFFKYTNKYMGVKNKVSQYLLDFKIAGWAKIKMTNGKKGWVPSTPFVNRLYQAPQETIVIKDWNVDNDQVYSIGWGSSGRHFAYIVAGYIDGAVDGLTVRFYIDPSENIKNEKILDYTYYDQPINEFWTNNYQDLQEVLNIYRVTPSEPGLVMKDLPVVTMRNNVLHLNSQIGDTITYFTIAKGEISMPLGSLSGSIGSAKFIGWITSPNNPNQVVVFVAADVFSSPAYVKGFNIDIGMFDQ